MRALLFLAPVLLAGCGSFGTVVPQHQILQRSREEVALREPWSNAAVILVDEAPNYAPFHWRVKAGAMDYSDYPKPRGIRLVAGTERLLRFTHDGCLVTYADTSSPCLRTSYVATAAVDVEIQK